MNRNTFLRKTSYALLGLGALSGSYAWQIEPFWLEFVYKKMPIQNLPMALHGKKLLQISDVHVGNSFSHDYLIESFIQAQALQPDFVVYTGDYVTYENEEQFEQLKKVFAYAVKGKMGTVGVLGNHDYGANWKEQKVADTITNILADAGVTILSNEKKVFNGLHIIGMDDFWGLRFDPKKALKTLAPKEPTIVLCHNPDVCDLDVWQKYDSWILSGHTHGGQCKPPFLPPPLLPVNNRRYTSGEFKFSDGRTLYINRALGHLFQVRFNVRPEITVFELTTV